MKIDLAIELLERFRAKKPLERYYLEASWTPINYSLEWPEEFVVAAIARDDVRIPPERREPREWWLGIPNGEGLPIAYVAKGAAKPFASFKEVVHVREVLT